MRTQTVAALVLAAAFIVAHRDAASAQASAAASGTVLVANQQSASATIIDLATRAETTIDVGVGPHEAAISPDGRWGVVTIYGTQTPGNTLAVIDLAARKVVRTIDLGEYRRPHGATFLPGSTTTVAVTSEASQNVVVVDINAGKILSAIPTRHPGSHMVGITAHGKHAFTSNVPWGGITEVDLEGRSFARDLTVAPQTEGVAVTPDGAAVWVGSNSTGTVSVVDTKTWKVAETLSGFGMPYRIGVSPNGVLAVICDPQQNAIHIADVASRKIVGSVGSLPSPRGVFIAPDNRTAFVTFGADNSVGVIDLVDRSLKTKFPVGTSPDGVAYGRVPAKS
jgi:YVTN family beta-propeller protein